MRRLLFFIVCLHLVIGLEEGYAAQGSKPLQNKKKILRKKTRVNWWRRYGESWKYQAETTHFSVNPHFDQSYLMRTEGRMKVKYENFQFKFGIKGQWQLDNGDQQVKSSYLDLKDTAIVTGSSNLYLTIGHTNVIWGRLDGISPNNKFSRADLSRPFDGQEDQTLGQTSLRMEYYQRNRKWDLLFLPNTWPHRLPPEAGPWFPLNRQNAIIQGMGPAGPPLAPLLATGQIVERREEGNSYGIRYGGEYQEYDFAVNYLRYTDLLPAFHLNEKFLAAPALGAGLPLLIKDYRQHHLYGLDFERDLDGIMWRSEFAYSTGHLVTQKNFFPKQVNKFEYGQGLEYSLENFNVNFNLQLNGQYFLGKDFLEQRHQAYLSGRVQALLAREIISIEGLFSHSLVDHSVMLMPKIVYKGWKNFDVYCYHLNFTGNLSSTWGYFRNHDLYGIGIKGYY